MPADVNPISERTVFLEALEQEGPEKREAYLAIACAHDASLRRRVEDLLRSHDEAASLFGKLAPQRLAQELASHPTDEPESQTSPSDGQSDKKLQFLSPSERASSLGRLGCYEVEEVVGAGGMGIVLKAFDERLHRAVAIKVMSPSLATNEHARRRFIREGRAAAAVRDDHVIGIHGVDETDGLPFLVMEYIVGRSLAERLEAEGPLPITDTLRIGGQIARGLAAAHAQGLVHRDIKPANILLENSVERVKITDFGIAHAVDDVRATQPGTLVGTPEYMSPEQARGERVDHRSDLFSLGCVLYAMCAGRPPFRAENTVAIIRRVCEDVPRPLSEINPEIPAWLENLIDKLIAKNLDQRFQSAAEVADSLEQFLAHVQQPAVVPLPAASAETRCRRFKAVSHGRRWSIAAAILLLLGAGLAVGESTGVTNVAATVIRIVRGDGTLVVELDDPNIQVLLDGEELVITGAGPKEFRLRPGKHELQSIQNGKPVETKVITIAREGRQVIKVAREPVAQAAQRESSRPPVKREQPALAEPIARRVWADAKDTSGSVSPNGEHLGYVDWETGDLAVRNLAAGTDRRLTNKGTWFQSIEFAMYPTFAADSAQIAYSWVHPHGKSDLRIMKLEGGDPRVLYSNEEELIETCGWAPDGTAVLAKVIAGGMPINSKPYDQQLVKLALISTSDGALRVLKESKGRNQMITPTMAPDGRTIAYSRATAAESVTVDIFLLEVDSGQETQVTKHAADQTILGWTPDGQHLLYAMGRQGAQDAWSIRIAGGKPQGEAELVKKDFGAILPLGFTKDGALYYGVSSQSRRLLTATLDLENGTAVAAPLAAERFNVTDQLGFGDWSSDGEFFAYWARRRNASQEIRIASMKTGELRVIKSDLKNIMTRMRWSPDGRSFVAAEGGHAPGIYQIDSASGQATPIVLGREASQPVWSADGQGIFYAKRPTIFGQALPNFLARKVSIVFRNLKDQTERDVSTSGGPDFDGRMSFWFEPSPDGRQLALMGKPNQESMILWLIPLDGGASRELLKIDSPETYPGSIGWTPDRRFILFTQLGGEEAQRGLWYVSADGGKPRQVAMSGVDATHIIRFAVHPKEMQLVMSAAGFGKSEVWALENFLPAPATKSNE